jgi:hypothetical protein
MTPQLHFTLKISADLFRSIALTNSAQPSFQNVSELRSDMTHNTHSPYLSREKKASASLDVDRDLKI